MKEYLLARNTTRIEAALLGCAVITATNELNGWTIVLLSVALTISLTL